MQHVKHNIDSLTLMNVPIDFGELSIHVLNGLGSTYLNISHALQVQESSVTFEELFEHLLNYKAKLQLSVSLAPLATTLATTLVTSVSPSSRRRSHNNGNKSYNRSHYS